MSHATSGITGSISRRREASEEVLITTWRIVRILAAVVGVAVIPFAGILAAAFVRFDLSKLSLEAPRFRTPEITLPWDTEQLASSDGGPKALGESSPDGGATSKREADIESTS